MNRSRIPSLLCACGVALATLGTPLENGTCLAQCTSCGVGYGTASALTTYTPAYTPRPSRRGPGYNIPACVTCKPRSYLAVPRAMPQPAVYVPPQMQPCSLPTCTPTYCTPTYCTPTCDPCGATSATCYRPVTAYRPVTTWVARPSLVPYISYRQPWTVTAYPTYAYYGTTYAAPVTSCVSGCTSRASNGMSGCSSRVAPPPAASASASAPYYPGASNSVSPADVTPSLPSAPAAPTADSPAPKTFEKPIPPEPEPKPRSTLKPIPENETRNTPATPRLIDPYGRTTSLPIRQASYFRTIPNTPQPVAQPLDNGGWRAASD